MNVKDETESPSSISSEGETETVLSPSLGVIVLFRSNCEPRVEEIVSFGLMCSVAASVVSSSVVSSVSVDSADSETDEGLSEELLSEGLSLSLQAANENARVKAVRSENNFFFIF